MVRLIAGMAILFMAIDAYASVTSISPDGINSINLPLTGAGVSIGQVEYRRPGKFGFDDGAHSNFGTVPAAVFIEDGVVQPTMNSDAELLYDTPPEQHATWVAGVMIGKDPIAPGVAEDAALYASGGDITNLPTPILEKLALSAQHIALQDNDDVRAINMSFSVELEPGHSLDGNNLLTHGRPAASNLAEPNSPSHSERSEESGAEIGSRSLASLRMTLILDPSLRSG